MQEANRGVDWVETSVDWFSLVPNENYRFENHFDRGRKGETTFRSVAGTFQASAKEIRNHVRSAQVLVKGGDYADALQELGEALHTIQDLCAHSNLVDLSDTDQQKTVEAVFDQTLPIPAGLILTSYVTTSETEFPTDDPLDYTHGAKSKDKLYKNDESQLMVGNQTKFEAAFNLADHLFAGASPRIWKGPHAGATRRDLAVGSGRHPTRPCERAGADVRDDGAVHARSRGRARTNQRHDGVLSRHGLRLRPDGRLMRQGVLKVRVRGTGGFTLDEPAQGTLATTLVVGGTRYCGRFDTPHHDVGTVNEPTGVFVDTKTAAPTACDDPPLPTPVPTATP